MNEPLISVVIPVHNRADMVRETLAGVRAQTYSNLETIVVDDGSTDDSLEIAKRFPLDIRTFRIESAKGPSAARNIGIDLANGEYICFIDDDDLVHPKHIEELVACAVREEGDAIVCGRWRRFRIENGKVKLGPIVGGKSEPDDDWLMRLVDPQGEGRIALMACLWPKTICVDIGWDEELFTNGDLDFYGRCILSGYRFVGDDAGMGYYRSHSGLQVAGTRSERSLKSGTRYRFRLCERLKDHPNRAAYAVGLRRGLMSLAITWATMPGNNEVIEKLVRLYREWGGKQFEVPVAPRNPIKRAIAVLALRVGGPRALGRLMRLRESFGRDVELSPLELHDRDPRDDEDLRVIESLLQADAMEANRSERNGRA